MRKTGQNKNTWSNKGNLQYSKVKQNKTWEAKKKGWRRGTKIARHMWTSSNREEENLQTWIQGSTEHCEKNKQTKAWTSDTMRPERNWLIGGKIQKEQLGRTQDSILNRNMPLVWNLISGYVVYGSGFCFQHVRPPHTHVEWPCATMDFLHANN